MNLFKELFSELSGFKSIQEAIGNNTSPVSVTGLSHIHRAQLAAALGSFLKSAAVLDLLGTP